MYVLDGIQYLSGLTITSEDLSLIVSVGVIGAYHRDRYALDRDGVDMRYIEDQASFASHITYIPSI